MYELRLFQSSSFHDKTLKIKSESFAKSPGEVLFEILFRNKQRLGQKNNKI